MYLLSIIQFYFRDYESCYDNLKILASDVKVINCLILQDKSVDYFNSINELITICQIILNRKEVELEPIYNIYLKAGNHKKHLLLRFLLIYIRMLEGKRRFNEIPRVLLKSVSEIIIPHLNSLLYEKVRRYFYIRPQFTTYTFQFQISENLH